MAEGGVGFFGAVFQNVGGLAVQGTADGVEGGEADGFGLSGFENGQVCGRDADALGQLLRGHLPAGKHDVQIDDDGHGEPPLLNRQTVLLLDFRRGDEAGADDADDQEDEQHGSGNQGKRHIPEGRCKADRGDREAAPGDQGQQARILPAEQAVPADVAQNPKQGRKGQGGGRAAEIEGNDDGAGDAVG